MAATQFEIDNALMAGRAYFDTRASTNRFPVPQGWAEFKHRALDSGFEAMSFQRESNPNEIVISYAGTGPGLLPGSPGFVDWIANSGLALGFSSDQLRQAALYYLEVKAANPGAVISFTGHSLGGGLAALMAVFFDEQAVAFDQAPFANSATLSIREDLIDYLKANGYTDATLSALVPELLSFNPYDMGSRVAKVTGYFVEGEALAVLQANTSFQILGAQTMLPQNSTGLGLDGPIDLHSQTLLTAFLLNDDFRALSFDLPNLLQAMFDKGLYAESTEPGPNAQRNFLDNLLRHQIGVAADPAAGVAAIPADGMLDRFVVDLQKLTPDTWGTASGTDMAKALTVAAMEYRYFKDAAGATQLFTFDSYGLHFKYSDIGAASYKSLPKLAAAVNAFLTLEERALLNGKLVKQDAWHIQSGVGGMVVHAGADNDALIGGANSDGLWGGTGIDILIGGANNDVLAGEAGNDYLLGGIGFDTYILNPGDGYDTVLDSDGSGVIVLDAVEAKGSAGVAPDKWYQLGADNWIDAQNGISYTRVAVAVAVAVETQLLVRKGDSNVLVKGWSDGELGITLGAGVPPPEPPAFLAGDSLPDYLEAASGGQRVEGLSGADMILGSGASGADHLLGGDGADWIVGNGGADRIEGGLGNDYISGMTANSQVYGGDGNDLITAAVAEGVQLLNIGNPDIPGLTADILWADAQSGFGRSTGLVYDSNGNLDLTHGSVPLAPYGGASALGGGWNFSMAFGGGTWSITYTHPTLAPGGKTPTGTWEHFIVPVSLTEGVCLFGEAGDDLIVGNDGADYLDGGSGTSQVLLIGRDGGADGIRVQGWSSGQLGLAMTGAPAPAATTPIVGVDGYSDALTGGGADLMQGLSGNDALDGSAGDDVIDGGLGDDLLGGNTGSDLIYGGAGRDMILSATGLNLSWPLTHSGDWYAPAGAGPVWTQGRVWGIYANGDGSEIISGGGSLGQDSAADIVFAGDDDDKVVGGLGADYIDGGLNNDSLWGHGGNDVVDGGDGDDYILGDGILEPGFYQTLAETLHGNDVLDGGTGIDIGGDDRGRIRWWGLNGHTNHLVTRIYN